MSKRKRGQPTGKDRDYTKPNIEYRMNRDKPEPFKGHAVNPAKQSEWRRDGLTNHERLAAPPKPNQGKL